MQLNDHTVSFDDEKLILVDENDKILGYKNKDEAHDEDGILHRAFSLFIFNENKELLLQKRSQQKKLWPLFWSNSVCSHPRKGEDYNTATQRRLKEELGIRTPLNYLFRFQYQAKFGEEGSEHELCSVYIGKTDGKVTANTNEIADWKFIDFEQLELEIDKKPEKFTPWLKIELKEIRRAYMHNIKNLYVVDSSFMPTMPGIPHTWTIMANALKVSDHLETQFKKRNL